MKEKGQKRRLHRPTLAIAICVVVFGLIFGFVAFKNAMIAKYMRSYKAPASTVSVMMVKAHSWHPELSSVGTVQAKQGVTLSPQVAGVVTKIFFRSGQMVQKGQELIELDTDVLKAELAQAKAQAHLARLTFKRQQKLYQEHAVSASDFDNARATLESDQAAVAKAKSLLDQKTIRTPFSGQLGIRQVNLGQYLNAGDAITSLQMLSPIYVNYYLPEQDINQLSIGQSVDLTVDSFPGHVFKGKIHAIDAQVGNDTKSIEVQAVFANQDKQAKLLPGMFGQVATILPTQNRVITIPKDIIDYTLYGDSVFVIDHAAAKTKLADKVPVKSAQKAKTAKDNMPPVETVKAVNLTIGLSKGNQVEVLKGLTVGDQVVTQGQIKLRNGSSVIIVPAPGAAKSSQPVKSAIHS